MEIGYDSTQQNLAFHLTKKLIYLFIVINHIIIFKNELILFCKKVFKFVNDLLKSIFRNIMKNRSLYGMIIFSIIWISIISFLIYSFYSGNDFYSLLNVNDYCWGLKLNEWGDFFAGFMAPLALGWLAYSIYYQKKEFENVHSSLKEQVLELEMEKHYSSYEQQINKIDSLITIINSQMNTITLRELNEKFTLSDPINYMKVATNIQKVFLLNKNIHNLFERHNSEIKSVNALKMLKDQYNIIYAEDIEIVYKMLLKYYFLITISKKEIKHAKPYEVFYTLDHWLTEAKKDEILKIIESIEEENIFSKKIDPAFKKLEKNYKDYLFLVDVKEENESI